MSINAISDIQTVERQAEEIRKDARKAARESADALRFEASQTADANIAAKRSELTKAFEDAQIAVKKDIQLLSEKNKVKCQEICRSAEEKLGQAQSFILERTVKHYGSR